MEKVRRSKGRMIDRRKMDGGNGEGLNRKDGREQREKKETEKSIWRKVRRIE